MLLLYPPLTDPTSPYHSLTYLRSHAVAQGFCDITIRDTNIEAFHHTLRPGPYRRVVQDARQRQRELLARTAPSEPEEREMALLLTAEVADRDALLAAVRTLRSPEEFYDYARYRAAVGRIQGWMGVLSTLGFPGQFHGFDLTAGEHLDLSNTASLRAPGVLERLNQPFRPYWEEVLLPQVTAEAYDLIGLNITYTAQLPFALHLADLLRRHSPGSDLVCGGTEVSHLWKYRASDETYDTLLETFDASVIGEGESAFLALLRSRTSGGWPEESGVRPAARHRAAAAPAAPPVLQIEKLAGIATPDYDGLPWDLYLSPHRFVYYSPTRGCYWNKCTFCDYGLNGDGPTSPWRQDPAERVVQQVAQVSRQARFVYFSVDVLAPAMMLRFAEEVIERGIDVRWGAEIRLERYWSPQKCATLRRSGCVAVSVGFESGNDRVLSLIDKGVTVEQTRRTVHNLAEAGIAVQMMGFTGFPGESAEEALDSVRFLAGLREQWTFGGLGSFDLTSGAIIAKQPERFGIRDAAPRPGTDIHRLLQYTPPVVWSAAQREEVRRRKLALQSAEFDRPWVGGTDTPHSYFYHARYGTGVLEALAAARPDVPEGPEGPEVRYVLNGRLHPLPEGWTADGFPRTAVPRIRRSTAGEEPAVPFLRADGAVFALPPALARQLRRFTDPEPVEAPGPEAGRTPGAGAPGGEVPGWLRSAVRSDVLRRIAPAPTPALAGTE